MKKGEEGTFDLSRFEQDSKEAHKVWVLSLKELEQALDGKKAITDKTKMASVAMGIYAKLKGAEVHRIAVEIMMRKRYFDINEVPQLPPVK